jgi:hypothetical protein
VRKAAATIRTRPTKPKTVERTITKVRWWAEDDCSDIAEEVVDIGNDEACRVGLADEVGRGLELETDDDVTKDETSIVFVIVAAWGDVAEEGLGDTIAAVTVVEAATGSSPFNPSSPEGRRSASSDGRRVGRSLRTRIGRPSMHKMADRVPLMLKIWESPELGNEIRWKRSTHRCSHEHPHPETFKWSRVNDRKK